MTSNFQKNNLGQFLYSERIRRNGDNITKYLVGYKIGISESYYRDIENGRKAIRLETAKDLCASLKLDPNEFFFFLLKDVLPDDVFSHLIKPSQKSVFESASKEIENLKQDLEVFRKAYKSKMAEEGIYEVDEEILKYLAENFDFLPVIHFVYMRRSCSFDDLKKILKKNNIEKSFESVMADLVRLKLAYVDKKKRIIQRHKRTFRIPRTPDGVSFKDKFVLHEVKKAIECKNRDDYFSKNNSFIHSSINCLSLKNSEYLINKIADLVAATGAGEVDLEEKNSMPFFLSIIVSSREIYDAKTEG